jgi:hypothetical protein
LAHAFLLTVLLLGTPAGPSNGTARPLDTQRIERLTGAHGTLETDGSFRLGVPQAIPRPRGRARLTPAPELASWASFTRDGEVVVVVAGFVLTRAQVAPTLAAALDAGLEVTALHDQFFWDDPPFQALHVRGRGTEEAMAAAVGRVLKALRTAGQGRAAKVAVAATDAELVAVVAPLLGDGHLDDGLYRVEFGVPGAKPTAIWGGERPGAWAAFAGSPARAMVAGDLAIPAAELQATLQGLRHGGFEIAAIHPGPAGGRGPLVVLSYWGVGDAATLAQALRDALQQAGVLVSANPR